MGHIRKAAHPRSCVLQMRQEGFHAVIDNTKSREMSKTLQGCRRAKLGLSKKVELILSLVATQQLSRQHEGA